VRDRAQNQQNLSLYFSMIKKKAYFVPQRQAISKKNQCDRAFWAITETL
jgi:hypothetical protein